MRTALSLPLILRYPTNRCAITLYASAVSQSVALCIIGLLLKYIVTNSTVLRLAQGGNEFQPVEVGRSVLTRLHRSEVMVKEWGAPIGNQYYRSVMPDFPISLCGSCNKVSCGSMGWTYIHNKSCKNHFKGVLNTSLIVRKMVRNVFLAA